MSLLISAPPKAVPMGNLGSIMTKKMPVERESPDT
jgi:hypothetical protein